MKEQLIVRQILDGLAAHRIFAFRLGTGSFFGESAKGKSWAFRAHSLGKGAGDILALPERVEHECGCISCGRAIVGDFLPLWIEVKNEKGKQSPEQKSFQEYVEGLGHRYVLARDWSDVEKTISA